MNFQFTKTVLIFIVPICLFVSPLDAQTRVDKSAANSASADAALIISPDVPPAHSTTTTHSVLPSSNDNTDDKLPFMSDEHYASDAHAPSATAMLVRTLGALLLIVGLIVIVSYGLRRFGGARFSDARAENKTLDVISTVSLGDKRSLAVVRFEDQTLLIGTTPHSISFLAKRRNDDKDANNYRSVADLLNDDWQHENWQQDENYTDEKRKNDSHEIRDALAFNQQLSIASLKLNSLNASSAEDGEQI